MGIVVEVKYFFLDKPDYADLIYNFWLYWQRRQSSLSSLGTVANRTLHVQLLIIVS